MVLLSTSEYVDELDIQDLLQRFSAVFHEKTEKNGLTSLDHRIECAPLGSAGLLE